MPTVAGGRPPAPRCSGPARLTTATPAEGRRGAAAVVIDQLARDQLAVLVAVNDLARIFFVIDAMGFAVEQLGAVEVVGFADGFADSGAGAARAEQ